MPRTARQQSASGIYHIMLRGINKQTIFNEAEDYRKMLQVLHYCVEKSGVEVYAYCFMHNHIHLLLKEGIEPLAITFRRLGSKYVYWYNTKYERVGHLFQDRFKSEAIEDDSYFLTVLRYIHLNPVKAGIVHSPEEYPYSSYYQYFHPDNWISNKKVLTMISQEQFEAYHHTQNDDVCLEVVETEHKRLTDEQAKKVFFEISNCDGSKSFQSFNREVKKSQIKKLKQKGLSLRQIVMLTEESYYLVQKI